MQSIHQNFQFSTPFLHGYRILKIPIVNGDGLPVWPEVFPSEKVQEMRETVGIRHFSAQMMLDYISDEKARLDPGALHFYDWEFDSRSGKLGEKIITGYACYWDPSIGKTRSDGSVCVLIYRDDKNRCVFIHDVKYLKTKDTDEYPLTLQCENVLNFMNFHNKKVLGIEVNGLGVGLPEIITPIIKNKNQDLKIQKIINSKRKEIKILDSIEPLLSTGKLYAHERIRNTGLLMEMMNWTPISGGHDDGLDALSGALRMQSIPIRPMGSAFKYLQAETEFKI